MYCQQCVWVTAMDSIIAVAQLRFKRSLIGAKRKTRGFYRDGHSIYLPLYFIYVVSISKGDILFCNSTFSFSG